MLQTVLLLNIVIKIFKMNCVKEFYRLHPICKQLVLKKIIKNIESLLIMLIIL